MSKTWRKGKCDRSGGKARDAGHEREAQKIEMKMSFYLHVLGGDHGCQKASERIRVFPVDRH